ncbi:MAG: DUF2927 domain-containing protein, partial [Paracoccaceae bacterium]
MRIRAGTTTLCLAALNACTLSEPPPAPPVPADIPRFAAASFPRGVARSNAQIADDFMELVFRLETGEQLAGLLKYEHPVTIALASPELSSFQPELTALLTRLRTEAGIAISQARDPSRADIRVYLVPPHAMQRAAPGAACFIAPGVPDWQTFSRMRASRRPRWSDQTKLGVTSIFIPNSAPPQEVRDCLHEEIAQALGPVNDIYRIPDTVFNDDNFESVLTPFDMLVLRMLYSGDLTAGMPRHLVAGRLPRLIDRINPKGIAAPPYSRAPDMPGWDRSIEIALDRSNRRDTRMRAAARAVRLARAMKPTDHRLGVANMALGRLLLRDNPRAAAEAFLKAYGVFRDKLGTRNVRTAQAAMHVGVIALHDGRPDVTLLLADQSIPAARKAENALLLSGLLALRSAARARRGRGAESQ